MTTRVVLLGELIILLGSDFTALYLANKGDLAAALAKLPRVGFAAALLWALLYFLTDVGLGVWAALFGLLVVSSFALGLAGAGTAGFNQLVNSVVEG